MPSRLLLDTNVLIDYAVEGRPEHPSADVLMRRIAVSDVLGYTTSGSLKDFYHLCRKPLGGPGCRELIRQFLILLTVLPVGQQECRDSAYSDEPDFEDGLIRAAAEQNDVDFIITRDSGAFARSPVKSLTAARYLQLFG